MRVLRIRLVSMHLQCLPEYTMRNRADSPVLPGAHGDFTHTYVQLDIDPFTNASTTLRSFIRWKRLAMLTCWSAGFHTVTEIVTRLKWQTRLSTCSMKCVTSRCNIDPKKRFCFESASTQDRVQQVCCLA